MKSSKICCVWCVSYSIIFFYYVGKRNNTKPFLATIFGMSTKNIKEALQTTFSHHVKLVQANRSSKLLIDFLYKRLNASSSNGFTNYSALKDNSISLKQMLENLRTVVNTTYPESSEESMSVGLENIINTNFDDLNENEQLELLKKGFNELNKLEDDKILNNEFKMKIQEKFFDQIRDYMLNGNPSEDFAELDTTNPSPSEV